MSKTDEQLRIIPISLREANNFVSEHHRHHKPVTGHKFSIGCNHCDTLVGVAIVGRPISRHLDNGYTLEVSRLCTDGTKNACSKLYTAAMRAAKELGYDKIITYILESENGASLRASGWECAGEAGGKHWTGERYPLKEAEQISLVEAEIPYLACMKQRYEKILRKTASPKG